MRVICILFSPGVSPKIFGEVCLRITPQVALGEHWIFLEIGKCRKLYSETTVLARLRALLSRFGLFAKLAAANDMPTALAFARYNCQDPAHLPIRALTDYLNPFDYNHQLDRMLNHLEKLGLYTLDELTTLPKRTLVSRFGKEGMLVVQRYFEADRILWPRFQVAEKIEENIYLNHPPHDLEPLLFHIKTLTDRVSARLKGRGEKLSRFSLIIHQEKLSHIKNAVREFQFDLPLAQSSTLLTIIRERLGQQLTKTPLQSSVEVLELKVNETVPLKFSQGDFLDRSEEEREAKNNLVARLVERLGSESVFSAELNHSFLPEKSWAKSQVAQSHQPPPYPLRPLRVLKKAQPLSRVGDRFSLGDHTWKVLSFQGPERIKEEWWLSLEFDERDYYQVLVHSGERLWVYQKHNQFFLHGFF